MLLLTACSNIQAPPTSNPVRFDYITSIAVSPSDDPEEIGNRYDASIISWHPEAGFAVLGYNSDPDIEQYGDLALLSEQSTQNRDAIAAPTANANGMSAWAGGISAWAGGISAWAGGISAWAGGDGDNPFPGNEDDWSVIKIAEAQALAPNLGGGVKVAVIDTGLDLSHPAFSGKLAPESEWHDFVDGDSYPQDPDPNGTAYGHGTAVAGIVLQAAPHSTILPLRVLNADGYGDISNVVAAIDWALKKGARVINLSLGTNTDVTALNDIINLANSSGVPVIMSSGNTGDTNVTYPAARSIDRQTGGRPIGVGSTNADDTRSAFSTYGSNLEMVAPGNGIATLYPDNSQAYASGTSFAAPWVSGTLALFLGEMSSTTNPSTTVTSTAVNIDALNPGYETKLGYGRLDAHAAVKKWLGIR